MSRLLIVEDSPTQAEQLRWSLEEQGFQAEVACDAEEALRRIQTERFDLVVSDIIMPGASGYELCEQIRSSPETRDVPVVLLSALNDPMTVIRALECGADNFLTKPYEPQHLLSRIRTALSNKAIRADGKFKLGIEVMFLGKRFTISSDKEQILDLLMSTFEDIVRTNAELEASREQLSGAKAALERHACDLEVRIEERTRELQERQEQLYQAQKMEAVGQLTGGMSHDFNNLLAVIIGNLEVVREKLGEGETAKALDEALDAAFRGADLNQRLLAFARRQTLQPAATSVNALIASTSKLLGPALGEQVELTLLLDQRIDPALVDAAQLEAAIMNLAVNARDAMPAGGKLTIRTSQAPRGAQETAGATPAPADQIVVEVSDTGSGMDPETLRRACDPFFTTKEEGMGSGLGLSMVHGFIEQSGGTLRIDSEVGKGSVIRLCLPVAKDAEPIPKDFSGGTLVAPAGESILIVEDNHQLRQVLTRQIRGLGYRAIEASNGGRALELLRSDELVDLLLTDIVMPGMDGRTLSEEAAKLRPGLKIAFMTGFADSSPSAPAAVAKKEVLLRKPFRRDELARALRVALKA